MDVPDIVYLVLWIVLFVGFWAFMTMRYRLKALRNPDWDTLQSDPPTYWEKLKYEHFILGPLFVHPDDPFTRLSRILVLLFNAVLVLALASIQFTSGKTLSNVLVIA